MLRQLAALFCLLLLHTHGIAAHYSFVRYNVLQGLSADQVNVVYTDQRGFTWIGTTDGLNRFDGKNFVAYTYHRNDPFSLPHNDIRSICEDQQGLLFVGTPSGVCRFNPWSGKAELLGRNMPAGKNYPACYGVYITPSGETWAWATDELWKLNPVTNRFDLVNAALPDTKHLFGIRSLLEDKQGRFWIAMGEGVCLLDRATQTAACYTATGVDGRIAMINDLHEDENGKLWCASWSSGIGLFHPETGAFTLWQWIPQPDNPSAANIAFGLGETKGADGKMWAATNNGLLCWDKQTFPDAMNTVFSVNNPSDVSTISDNNVQAIHVNSAQQVWTGGTAGISVLLPEFQLFQPLSNSYTGQTIRMRRDGSDKLFFCAWYGEGLQLIDTTGKSLQKWNRIPANATVENTQVSDACRDREHNLWVATFGGLSKGTPEGEPFSLLKTSDAKTDAICSMHINCIGCDSNGFIWAGSYGKGISKIDPHSLQCTNYTAAENNLPSDLIWDICITHSNEAWFATNNGVCRYNAATSSFEKTMFAMKGKDTIALGVCFSICEDRNSGLWISSENGLFHITQQSTEVFTRDDGLPSNAVSSVTLDEIGNVWIATANGLAQYVVSKNHFLTYNRANGLPSAALNGDICKVSPTRIVIGLHSRIVGFNPLQLSSPVSSPQVYIMGVAVGNKSIEFTDDPSLSTTYELDWSNNNVSFEFIAPGLSGGPEVQYSYRLAGSGGDWISSGHTHTASFAALAPGQYTFECKAAFGDEAWGQPVAFSFVITPPIWKTWWFLLLCFALITTLLVLIVRREAVRKIRLRLLVLEREQAVQRERDRISRDMHDDLGSGLTKIAILSEVVRKNIDTSVKGTEHIDTISESARNLVDNLNEIIWALNPENDNFASLGAYIREYAGKYLEPFDLSLTCDIPDNLPPIPLTEEQKRFLFLVVKEALNNIVKHARAKAVTIRLQMNGDELTIAIEDDGVGFESNTARPLGNGLRNIRKRVESIGGQFSVRSSVGAGTSISMRVPLR